MLVKAIDSVASMIAPGEGEPEGQPEGSRGGVDSGRLAHPFLRDRRQRVVVQLRDQQPESGSRDHQRDQREHQPESRPRYDGTSTTSPTVSSRNPTG